MNVTQIEENIRILFSSPLKDDYIYDILRIYGLPKASITRLQKGNLNLTKTKGDIVWKKKLHFKKEYENDLHEVINRVRTEISHKERFVIVTDDKALLAYDTKTDDTLDILLAEWPEHYDFFLPWAGIEKTAYQNENPADVKAAVKMAKLFDEIKKDNPQEDEVFRHNLNVFLSRILFCLFAEDTGIFEEDQFTNAIGSNTNADGSDLHTFLERLFEILNTSDAKRGKLPAYLSAFPYVNGGLFEQSIAAPTFTRKSRKAIIDAGTLQWKDINPDIFGSMFQAVIGADQRGSLGQHYTSVPNIMKVIEPLFLNELREEFEKAKSSKDYDKLLSRIWNIKIFDPACGSGNFLIIAYKELRKLEIEIFQAMKIPLPFSSIELGHFYGIEYDDFAGEIAKLALWLAEHQMNSLFKRTFGKTRPTLPLKEAGKIVHGNACRLDWEEVCPKGVDDEVYILGNPPYLGKKKQSDEQKKDLAFICGHIRGYKNLDYIACWFYKGALYSNGSNVGVGFVSTNSICQGEQVGIIWPAIFDCGTEIDFAHTSFMWKNNAKKNAGVAVVIIGFSRPSTKVKYLFVVDDYGNNSMKATTRISPYLTSGTSSIVSKRRNPISNLPEIANGSMANDDGNFFITDDEYIKLSRSTQSYFRKVLGARELFHCLDRYCLWLDETDLLTVSRNEYITTKIENVRIYRLKSARIATNKLACVPYRFGEVRYKEGTSLIVPGLSAEKREYIPVSILSDNEIVTNLAQVIYDFEPWLMGLLSSKLKIVWVQTTSGFFKKDLRVSPILSYNNFPFPPISDTRKQELTESTFRILAEREKHPEKTLAQLYDPDKMPDGLREAHKLNDLAVERCYRSKPFESDEERLEYLFKLYEKMIQEEKERDTLFAKEKKGRKKKK